MNIFPDSVAKFIDASDASDTMRRFADFIQTSLNVNQSWWVQANLDQRYEAGDQSLWTQYYNAWQIRPGKQFTFNIIRPQVSTLEGYQRAHRKNTIYTPLENGTQEGADAFSDISIWHNQQENVAETLSTAFRQSLITGLSLVEQYLDFRTDPINGDIKYYACAYNQILMDPFWKDPTLADCRGIVKRTYVTQMEAVTYLPDHAKDIMNMSGFMPAEFTFQYMPENYQYTNKNLITYDEFYYPAVRRQKMLVDTATGETKEWRNKDNDALRAFLQHYRDIEVVNQDIPTVRMTIVIQGRICWDDAQPNGCDFWPFTPVYAFLNPELEDTTLRWAGIVRSLRDSQFLFNHRKVLELQLNESVANSGWLVEEDAVVNPDDLYKPYPGQVIYAKKGKLPNVTKIPASPIDPTYMQASRELLELTNRISNISETAMGQNTDALSGFHEQMKTATNLVANQRLFDQLDTAQKILGRKFISMVQNNWTPGKIRQIIKREVPQEFYDKTFGKYDAQVELSYDTVTQKQLQFSQLFQLHQLGLPIPASTLVNAASVQNKSDLIKQMDNDAKAAAEGQKRAEQLQMLKLQAEIDMASAQAQVQRGYAVEKISEIQTNEAEAVERRSLAAKNQQQAALDMVKATKDIDSITIEQLGKLFELSKAIQDFHQIQNEKIKASEAEQKEAVEQRAQEIMPQANAEVMQ